MKTSITSIAVGDSFRYCGKVHKLLSISKRPDGRLAVQTDHHLFNFPVSQKVTRA